MNGLSPAAVEAMEVYASAAQVPTQYNRTSCGCGVAPIWTREYRTTGRCSAGLAGLSAARGRMSDERDAHGV